MKNRIFLIGTLCACTSLAWAQPLKGKLVDTSTGSVSAAVALSDGACFKMGDKTYRLVIESEKGADLKSDLEQRSVPVYVQDLAIKEAFSVMRHLCGASIVCARDVDQTLKVSVNTQDDSLMSVLEQICFQIGAEVTIKKGVIWITMAK